MGGSPGVGVRHTDLDLAQPLTLSGTLHKLFNLCELHLPQLLKQGKLLCHWGFVRNEWDSAQLSPQRGTAVSQA